MSLLQRLGENLKENLKGHREMESGTLRLLLSAIHNREIEKRSAGNPPQLTDLEVIEVLQKEVKKRREAAHIYMEANRPELAEKENKELEFIQTYLPEAMDVREIETIVDGVIQGGTKEFGPVMKKVLFEIGSKAEAGVVSGIVKKKLGGR